MGGRRTSLQSSSPSSAQQRPRGRRSRRSASVFLPQRPSSLLSRPSPLPWAETSHLLPCLSASSMLHRPGTTHAARSAFSSESTIPTATTKIDRVEKKKVVEYEGDLGRS